MAARLYTYLFADLRTNAIIEELPLKNVRYSRSLNRPGALSATLDLGDSRVQKLAIASATQTARTAIYVDRAGSLVWGGVLWTALDSDQEENHLDLGAEGFWSALRRRLITNTKTYVAADQLFIARDLVNYTQAKPGGNIGITVGTELTTDNGGIARLRDRTYWYYEAAELAKRIEELAGVEQGFDFAIDVAYDAGGVPQKYLRLGYPRRGRNAVKTGWVFDWPGNIVNFQWPENGASVANSVFVAGKGENELMASASFTNTALIDAGYPLLEARIERKSESYQATLDESARAEVNAKASPIVLPSLKVRADLDPVIGSYIEGDAARIRIDSSNPRFPTGLDAFYRIVGWDVDVAEDETEEVTLTMGLEL